MKKLKHLLTILFSLAFSTIIHAQESPVGKFMRSEQRSYVVVAVMLTILIGVILYIVRLDKRISKMEKENR